MGGNRGLMLVAAAILALAIVGPAWAISPYDDVLVDKGITDLKQENYEEALDELTQAWQQGTHTARKAFLLGQVYRATLNYPKALEFLEEALKLQPQYPEAQLLLADTLVTLNRPEPAREQLEKLEAAGYRPAEVAMLRGQVAAKQGDYGKAVDYFRRAQQDPALAQRAKFQMSLALAAQNRLKEAEQVMGEVIALEPQSQLASFAQKYLGDLSKRARTEGPFHLYAGLGFDYDSNVSLQPGSPSAATQISGKGDVVFTQFGNIEYNPLAGRPFGLNMQYLYYQNFHPRVTGFDLMSHSVGLTPSYTFKNSRLWVPFFFNYTDVQSDKYYTGFDLNPTYLHLVTPKVGVETAVHLVRKYYWTPISIPQDDRSGRTVGGSLGLFYFLKQQQGYLMARFHLEHDYASGANWSNTSYRLLLASLYPVTDKLKFIAFLDLMLQPYDNAFYSGDPTVINPNRFDKVLTTGAQVTYEFYKGIEGNVHYYFVRDQSNIPLYNYSRHLVGVQLAYRY